MASLRQSSWLLVTVDCQGAKPNLVNQSMLRHLSSRSRFQVLAARFIVARPFRLVFFRSAARHSWRGSCRFSPCGSSCMLNLSIAARQRKSSLVWPCVHSLYTFQFCSACPRQRAYVSAGVEVPCRTHEG